GSGESTSPKARSEPAEPTSATTFSLVWVPVRSCSVCVTTEQHLTDNARVVLGLAPDAVGALSAACVPARDQPGADPLRQVGSLLKRAQRGGERGVELLRVREQRILAVLCVLDLPAEIARLSVRPRGWVADGGGDRRPELGDRQHGLGIV